MKNGTSRLKSLAIAAALMLAVTAAYAAMELTKYDVHDMDQPTPDSVKPATVHKVKGADGPTTKPTLDNRE